MIIPFWVSDIGVVFFTVSLTGMGLSCLMRPRRCIEWQIAFYHRINWKMEPLSWEREVRNTRLMGVLAILCGAAGFILCFYLYGPAPHSHAG